MKIVQIILIIVANLLTFNAKGCSCEYDKHIDLRQFNQYDIIVEGTILEVIENEEDWTKKVVVKVNKRYKHLEEVDTINFGTGLDDGSCSLYFMKGQKWLIYGYKSEGIYATGLCTRSTKLNFVKRIKLGSEKRFLRKYMNYNGKINNEFVNGELKSGRPIGKWIFKKNGAIWETYQYTSNSELNGICEVFRENGTLHYTTLYKNGNRVKSIYYDQEGNVTRIYD